MWPIQLMSPLYTTRICRIFLFSLTLCNTSSFLTRSAQLIFSILLQHHSSKLSRYFWPSFRSVHVSAPYTAMGRMWHFNCFFLTFKSYQRLTKVFMLNATAANAILGVTARVLLAWKYESEPAWPTRDTCPVSLSTVFWILHWWQRCCDRLHKIFYAHAHKHNYPQHRNDVATEVPIMTQSPRRQCAALCNTRQAF